MSKIRNNKIRKNYNESTKTAVLLQTLLPLLFVGIVAGLIVIPAAQAEAKSKFKIEVQICCVSSDSGNAKIKVKLPDGTSTSKNVNLGKLADEQDWDNVSVFFKLKHRYESFKVCVSGLGCQWGEAGDPVQFKGLQ
jgi:hypothetical protein